MPSRGSYQITSREEGKAAQRDESYKSCVLALLVFFFLCIILILACLPWKNNHTFSHDYHDQQSKSAQHHHGDHTESRITSTTESMKITEGRLVPVTAANEPEEIGPTSTTSQIEVFKHSNATNDTESTTQFARMLSSERSIDETSSATFMINSETTTIVDRSNGDSSAVSTESVISETSLADSNSAQDNDTKSTTTEVYTTIIATENVTEFDNSTAQTSNTDSAVSTERDLSEESTTSTVVHTNRPVTEVEVNTTAEVTTESTTISTTGSTTISTAEPTTISTTGSTTGSTTTSTTGSTTSTTGSTTPSTTGSTTTSTTGSTTGPTTISTTGSTTTLKDEVTEVSVETVATTILPFTKSTCHTSECKRISSKMLFYMNHTMDPCEDFYEYACGGFEANPQTIELDLENVALERIEKQMHKEGSQSRSSLFAKYYKSCMQYENESLNERTQKARQILDRVGKFYTTDDWIENHTDFTELTAKLLLHHSALLFDVTPVLDEYSPNQYTLKIGPRTYKSPFDTEITEDFCHANEAEMEQKTVDLGQLYKEYKTCKNDTKELMKSITEALTMLGVFNQLNNTYNITQYIQTTVINIDLEIVQNFFANYPPTNEIHEAYLTKTYSYISFKQLANDSKIVDWTNLIFLLTNELVKPEVNVQVYFYKAFVQGLKNLEKFQARNPMELNNAVLGLYARNLYNELVLSKHRNAKRHCLRIASNLLIPEASNLYISSFSSDELNYMNRSIRDTFDKLKVTLELKVNESEWTTEEEHRSLLKKVNDLNIAVPDMSYYTDENSIYKKSKADQVNVSGNFLEDSVTLLRRYRSLMYKEPFLDQGAEQIWTHYATPFQSKGLAIYGFNLVVVPYGVIDWSTKFYPSFDYLLFAILGNAIALQIAHHFDAIGIYYVNGTSNVKKAASNGDDITSSNFENYIDCQRSNMYHGSRTMALPSTGQTVVYEIPQLTLNERLSEIMGLRLTYDTLHRLRSDKEILLPWLELSVDQLFYLTYAQMHCTKSSLTSSYVSLYEDAQLPSRIRIFVSASNNKFLGEAWNCPDGSQIVPSYTCDTFPYLESDETKSVSTM